VSFDSAEENRDFGNKFDVPFPLLSDTERKTGMAYGACDAPDAGYADRISVLIDEEGTVLRVYPDVNPGEHPDQVLRDLDELRRTGPGKS
jgi:peroxiredoxin Q/BCP